jgi:DNA polymerase I-like protein with 3'-5' exonuclease and polymerase domains
MIIRHESELPAAIKYLESQLEVSYDIESTGLNVRRDQIIGLSSAGENFSFYVIHKAWVPNEAYADGGYLEERIPKQALLPLLTLLRSRRLITHNGSYDSRISYHYFGTILWDAIYADTMLMAHTLDENRFNYGMKELGAEIFGREVTAEKERMLESIKANGGSSKQFYKADPELIAEYGRADAELTYRLYKYFKPRLVQQGLWDFFAKQEVMPLYTNVTIPMELKGVPVDLQLLTSTKSELEADLQALEDQIQASLAPHLDLFNEWYLNKEFPVKLTGPFIQAYAELCAIDLPKTKTGAFSLTAANIESLPDCKFKRLMLKQARLTDSEIFQVRQKLLSESGTKYPFNILSKDHLKRLFFTKLGETPLSTTDKGNPQVNEEFLDKMAEKYPWARKLVIYNRLTKILGTYVDRFIEGSEDGVFFPNFNQHRTVSGRYSGDLQQLSRPLEEGQDDPRVVKYNNRIRRFFISGPGHTFADFDYDSQEVKVFAHISGEQSIKDIFANGDDFYSAVCIAAEGLTGYSANKKADNYLGKVNKAARQRAKAYALGLAFNMSPYKLKFELNCSEEEAIDIYNKYFTAYPKLKEWLESSKASALKNGYIKTEAGRVRRFPDLKRYYAQYGDVLFNGLELWKKYNETPATYKRMKEIAGICKNELNNAANVQVQGLGSSITNRAAIKTARALKAAGLKAWLCNVVHDQLTVLTPDEELEQACKILQHSMETAYEISVPLTAPPSWGKNFAESK